MNSAFTFRVVGSTGCEILCDGSVVAWAGDEMWAVRIVALMNNAPSDAVGRGGEMPEAARCCGGTQPTLTTRMKE
jgi:hypothetical protein